MNSTQRPARHGALSSPGGAGRERAGIVFLRFRSVMIGAFGRRSLCEARMKHDRSVGGLKPTVLFLCFSAALALVPALAPGASGAPAGAAGGSAAGPSASPAPGYVRELPPES